MNKKEIVAKIAELLSPMTITEEDILRSNIDITVLQDFEQKYCNEKAYGPAHKQRYEDIAKGFAMWIDVIDEGIL